MNQAEIIQSKERDLLDHFPTKKHMTTGKSGKTQLKHQEIDLKKHLGRLRIAKNKGRNDDPETKLKKPKAKEFE